MRKRSAQSGFSFLELLIVVAMGLIVAGFAVPTYQRAMRNYALMGDSRAINGEIQLAKMRAAANFTRVRVKFLANGTYQTEVWCKAQYTPRVCTAVADALTWKVLPTSGNKRLSNQISYGVGSQTLPPPSTQATLAQPMTCQADLTTTNPEAGTRCIIFNSRGYPVDEDGDAYGNYAIYITDGTAVQGTTVSRTGATESWRHDVQDTLAESWFRH